MIIVTHVPELFENASRRYQLVMDLLNCYRGKFGSGFVIKERNCRMSRNVLVVVAHPDDEVLGIGGAIAKHVRDGDNVFCVSMTDGVGSRSDKKSSVEKRAASADAAARALGFSWLKRLKFNDNALDSYPLEIIY